MRPATGAPGPLRWLAPATLFLLATSCGGPSPASGPRWPGARCEARLGGAPPAPLPGDDAPTPLSRVLVDVEVVLDEALRGVEQAVPRRLAERRGVHLGDAGRLAFTIDRGPFTAGLDGDDLTVSVALLGQAEVCKPLGILGCVPYGSCSPAGQARASIALRIDESLRLPPSRVAIQVTRPCTLSALGVDVTGEVQTQANLQADELRRRIDATLPALDATVDSLWRALATTVPVGAAACARVVPRALVQTGPRRHEGVIAVGLGMEGEVSLESPCQPGRSASPPRPAPVLDRDAPAGIDLRIPHRVGWDEVSLATARALAGVDLPAGAEVLRATDARAAPGPDGRMRLTLTVAGKSCGDLALDADVAPADGGARIAHLEPAPGEPARLPGLDLDALSRSIERRLRVPLPTDVSTLSQRLDSLASRLLAPGEVDAPLRIDLAVHTEPAQLERVVVAREGLVAIVVARGQARLSLHPAARPR